MHRTSTIEEEQKSTNDSFLLFLYRTIISPLLLGLQTKFFETLQYTSVNPNFLPVEDSAILFAAAITSQERTVVRLLVCLRFGDLHLLFIIPRLTLFPAELKSSDIQMRIAIPDPLSFWSFFSAFGLLYTYGYALILRNWNAKQRPEASSYLISLFHGIPAAIMAAATIMENSRDFKNKENDGRRPIRRKL